MTIRGLGRAMPVHVFMVNLAGIELTEFGPVVPSDDAAMADIMRLARDKLRRWCKVDFGADLAAWRDYLMSADGEDSGYRHPYSFENVDRRVVAAIDDPRRRRIAELLDREIDAGGR